MVSQPARLKMKVPVHLRKVCSCQGEALVSSASRKGSVAEDDLDLALDGTMLSSLLL